jgi:uncharacterized protein
MRKEFGYDQPASRGFRPYKSFLILQAILFLFAACRQSPHQENKLALASSPYLQQHADNPVHWFEWGEDALEKARKENKPLLISIGYASCHWCHVMEKESFMDTAVARIMNEHFVNIKVDREERPDIDNLYVNAVQLLTGGAGWPLHAFALPDGKPFFAGTYYTKSGWIGLLKQISEAYRDKHELVLKQADGLTKGIATQDLDFLGGDSARNGFTKSSYRQLFDSIYNKLDLLNGGLKGSPKFPIPSLTEFLLQYYFLTGDHRSLEAATITLNRLSLGGIYDQLGGGFARYSVDTAWFVPHFEKMLYDNGQLLSVYAHAYRLTGSVQFKKIIEETAAFVVREMISPEGGFYSSLNAETEGQEGKYYTWTYEEISNALGNEEAAFFARYYNISPGGNWYGARNILYVDPANWPRGRDSMGVVQKLNIYRERLLQQRGKRVTPSVDTKILLSWNAIVQKGLLDAHGATGNPAYLQTAIKNARFLENNLITADGKVWRNFKEGKASISGFLDDYAWTAKAYIRLYQSTFDKHWLDLAYQIIQYAVKNFYDPSAGMFYYAEKPPSGTPLVARKIELTDNAIPSSNAVMANVLFELGVYFENQEFSTMSRDMLARLAGKMRSLTSYFSQWCILAGLYSYGTFEVAVMGKEALTKSHDLQRRYLPNCIFMGHTDKENLPLLENKLADDRTLIYVCTNRTCKLPVEEVKRAVDQVGKF